MKAKKILCTALALAMTLSLAACGGGNNPGGSADKSNPGSSNPGSSAGQSNPAPAGGDVASDPKVTLVYAEVNPADSIIGNVATAFKEKAEELSGGSITIDIQAGGVLGAENDVLDSIMAGSNQIDIARISVFALNSYGVQKTVLCTLPFTFESREHF